MGGGDIIFKSIYRVKFENLSFYVIKCTNNLGQRNILEADR